MDNRNVKIIIMALLGAWIIFPDLVPGHVDDIIAKTGLPTGSVLRHLTLLAIKGYIKRCPGNFYQLNIAKK